MMDYTIEVVCDSSRHARGKIAKVAYYFRDGDVWKRQRGAGRGRAWDRRGARVRAAGFKPDLLDIIGPDHLMPPKCKLCGKQLAPYVDAVLFPILNLLAAQGESRISIRGLNLLASKQQYKG